MISYLFGNEDTSLNLKILLKLTLTKALLEFCNINERSAFIFIRIIEVSFSLLNDFKNGMISKTETTWKPEMNLPEGFRWVRQYLN